MHVHVDPDVCQGHGLCERPMCESPPAAVPSKRSARASLAAPSLSEIPHDPPGQDFREFPLGIAHVLADVPGHGVLGRTGIFPLQGI